MPSSLVESDSAVMLNAMECTSILEDWVVSEELEQRSDDDACHNQSSIEVLSCVKERVRCNRVE